MTSDIKTQFQSCETGYSWVSGSCTDVDECVASTHQCQSGTTCRNTVGSYVCGYDVLVVNEKSRNGKLDLELQGQRTVCFL